MIRGNFRSRLWLAAVLPALLLTAVFAVVLSHWTGTVLESSLRERIEAVAKQLAVTSEFYLFTGDVATMRDLVEGLAQDESEIVSTTVYSADGTPWVSVGEQGFAGPLGGPAHWAHDPVRPLMWLTVPVVSTQILLDDYATGGARVDAPAPMPIGYVAMGVSSKSLNAERNRLLAIFLLVFVGAAVLGGGLSVLLARGVTRPLGHIVDVVERIGHGDLAARIEVDGSCVFAPLARDINQMAANVAVTQEELQRRVDEATRELQIQKLDAEREARSDPLTGLNNRRAFFELAERDVSRAARYDFPVALIMLDLDHFKSINDAHGHPAGDRVLVMLADTLRRSMREVDVLGRLGGEEFAILMPDTTVEDAVLAAERVREAVAAEELVVEGRRIAVTASLGISEFRLADDTIHDLFTRADRALYRAKQSGRNRVEVFGARGVGG